VTTSPRENPRHWSTTDGHHFVSVPAPVPTDWNRGRDIAGNLVYARDPYRIVRRLHGRSSWSYTVFRDGVELGLSLTSSLAEAKDRAVRNAEGRDTVDVA
jgi:hypothetical protein